MLRSYIDLVLELPWNVYTQDNLDIAHARQVLDDDHFGLKEVKERILEHLGVLKMNPNAKAPDPLPCWTSGRRQNLAGSIHRSRARPQL